MFEKLFKIVEECILVDTHKVTANRLQVARSLTTAFGLSLQESDFATKVKQFPFSAEHADVEMVPPPVSEFKHDLSPEKQARPQEESEVIQINS